MNRLFAIALVVFPLALIAGSPIVNQTDGSLAVPPSVKSPPPRSLSASALVPVQQPVSFEPDTQLVGNGAATGDRKAMLSAIDRSLNYLNTAKATNDYARFAASGITRDRVRRSLQRFRQLLLNARSASQLQAAVEREFALYQATGKDGQGTVGFTGYFEPVHLASRTRTKEFQYPIFRLPPNFATWKKPHPTRSQLEGIDGLQFSQGQLKGQELAWLRDRLEAYLIQVQGSARLKLTNGQTMTVGYAGTTDYPYVGIGRELVNDGKMKLEELTLPALLEYFRQNPADLQIYLPRNKRFIFFKETKGAPAMGSIGVPVTPERSIATDKTLFPPGALALIQAQIPYGRSANTLTLRQVTRYVLDQDTGGAIKGPGRVDIFMGTGQLAGDRAGLINSNGRLYYLLLKQ